jgi:hypothetical protein
MLDGMDNPNRDSADNWPTQQFWPASGQGGNGGHIPTPPGSNSPDPYPGGGGPRRPRHTARWVAGLAAAAVLVGGGTVALASSGRGASPSGQPTSQTAPTGQAATLNTVLSSADSPTLADMAAAAPTVSASTVPASAVSASAVSASTGAASAPVGTKAAAACARATKRLRATRHPVAAHRVRAVCRRRLARVRLLVHGIHGQFTYQTKKGAKTLAFERGTIQTVTGTTVTVKASDGTTWTWHLVSNTVVRQSSNKPGDKKVATSSLSAGQRVFVGGPVVSGADNARLIVIRPAA